MKLDYNRKRELLLNRMIELSNIINYNIENKGNKFDK
jgi:hypothetical protein